MANISVNSFSCPVCLNFLEDPVTIPCGRSFCKVCINGCWDQEDVKGVYSCPQCRETFTSRSVLRRNNILAEKVKILKKAAYPAHCYAGPGDVECDSCIGRKHKAVKSCLVCLASYCENHLKPHFQAPAFKKHKLVEACAELEDKICSQHDKPIEIYCRTDQSFICYLCIMDQHKGHDTIAAKAETAEKKSFPSLCVSPGSEDSPSFTVSQHLSFDGVRKSLSDLKKQAEDICEEEFNKIRQQAAAVQMTSLSEPKIREDFLPYFCYLTLDPNTAYPDLILCEKNRSVTRTGTQQRYSDHPERFDSRTQVLCKESVCGRCYWEVEWSGDGVSISVSYKKISRKGLGHECLFGYNSQSWSLECSSSSVSFRHDKIETVLRVPVNSRIGVYVDHSAGTLSFYSISDTMRLLHSVHATFTQPLYAGFWMWTYNSTVSLCDPK
ncbi:tripartite motif-containing protein 16-like [Ictalurus furcatus]|uniref:tripartite motif-containing protein 16-like n=1 Tax=Ictalurus furcatus TaxID=66913 RepID=UPI002350D28C|nr:tripartite motif-containing protein 16-like [Ictalurus furcatus]